MKAIMLAAGVGHRLGCTNGKPLPKILLRFGGKTLLQYHIEALKNLGIDELVLGVGFHHQDIVREIHALGAEDFVRPILNKDYHEGNILTLWTLRQELCQGDPVLLMDADVLYCEELLERLLKSRHENCMLMDRSFDSGDEPVKICVRDGKIIEFRKWLSAEFDFCGESVGFFKLSSDIAKKVIEQTELYIDQGRRQEPYEEAIRDVLLTSPRNTFEFEDITGLAWTEIDFPADVERANFEVLPQMSLAARSPLAAVKELSIIEQDASLRL